VVSTSPVRVKLGDFGISKRIQPQATTTSNTPVSTQIYGAPEVQGVDSNSETSVYTNSVDIWSLGCVIYELLVERLLFASETQVSGYFFGIWLFPDDKLKGLSPPTDDSGISLLKPMLSIQPEDCPTAENVLSSVQLVGLKSNNEDSGDDHKTAQDRDEISWRRKCQGKLTTHWHGKREKRNGRGGPVPPGDPRFASGDAASGTNPRLKSGSDPTASKSAIDISVMTLPGVASAEDKMDLLNSTVMSCK